MNRQHWVIRGALVHQVARFQTDAPQPDYEPALYRPSRRVASRWRNPLRGVVRLVLLVTLFALGFGVGFAWAYLLQSLR